MSTVISISTPPLRCRPGLPGLGRCPGRHLPWPPGGDGAACAAMPAGAWGAMSDADLVEAIRQVLADSPFHGEGYRKVWARLRHAGLRTSKERVRRLMRENGLSAATRAAAPAARAATTARSSPRPSTRCGEPT